jgi:hypothetical protein
VARAIEILNRNYDLVSLLGLRHLLEQTASTLNISIEIPTVEVNLLEEMVHRSEVAEVLGLPLGFPHCALTPEEGRAWATSLQVPDPDSYFIGAGCLYFGPNTSLGPNLFFHSSESIMLH